MIISHKLHSLTMWLLLTAFLLSAQEVSMITSNNVYDVAGSGDTAWLLTDAGLNFTADAATSPTWWGYTGRNFYSIAFGNQGLLALVGSAQQDTVNTLWLYDHARTAAPRYTQKTVHWNVANLSSLPAETRDSTSFMALSAVYADHAWWLACYDGGLVRWDPASLQASTRIPGFSTGYATTAFPSLSDTALKGVWLSRSRRCLRMSRLGATDSARIAVATPKAIWLFNPADSAWDSLSSRFAVVLPSFEFLDVQVNNHVTPSAVYASIAAGADTAVYRYDSAAGRWSRLYAPDPGMAPQAVRSVAFGRGGMVYVADEKFIFAYNDTNGTAPLPFVSAKPGASSFTKRLYEATADVDFTTLTIGSIAAFTSPADTMLRFWVATNQGIFFTRDEIAGEQADSKFIFVKRAPKIDAGLKTTYAYPGILVLRDPTVVPKATFAYNLSKDAKVTIRIYDWNMDLVKTVIDQQPRFAGSSRQSGRSTDLQDTWDGTNRDGVIVAPGVYYYVISTDTGVRSRGKIVVALSAR